MVFWTNRLSSISKKHIYFNNLLITESIILKHICSFSSMHATESAKLISSVLFKSAKRSVRWHVHLQECCLLLVFSSFLKTSLFTPLVVSCLVLLLFHLQLYNFTTIYLLASVTFFHPFPI